MTDPGFRASVQRLREAVGVLRRDMAIHCDALSADLARRLHMVPWDRAQVLGATMARIDAALATPSPRRPEGPSAVRVHGRRLQPLEALPPVAAHLAAGRRVHLSWEKGGLGREEVLLRHLAECSGEMLVLDGARAAGPPDASPEVPLVGVAPAAGRVAMVVERADPELAAYVLARTCLRRSGADLRCVRLAVVAGSPHRLLPHLRRLFLETVLGPPTDPGAFAGPVDPGVADAYLESLARLEGEGLDVVVAGGLLRRAEDATVPYVAPALFLAEGLPAFVPDLGPTLVVASLPPQEADFAFRRLLAQGRDGLLVLGGAPDLRHRLGTFEDCGPGRVTAILGALLVHRLPPGMPEPRPV